MATAVPPRSSILLIDDDEPIRQLLSSLLENYHCVAAKSAEDAIRVLKSIKFELVISDINMEGISGLELVPYVLREHPETVVVMMSGQQTIDTAIQAMRVGAFDYITKPLDLQHVEAAVRRALEHHQLLADKKYYENNLHELVQQRAAEIERLAHFDTLTDLPNRLLFEDRLTQALKRAPHDSQPLGTLLLRVDRFKELNDTLGSALGDNLLRDIAERIRLASGERGTLARFEGDEFALLITDINASENVLKVVQDIIESLKAAFVFVEHKLYVTVSIGVSLFPLDGLTSQELLQNAGVALYRAQSLGGNGYQFYQPEMNARALERLTMEGDSRRAIDNDELRLYYQPQVDLSSHKIVGAEALIRWQHPRLGLLPPSEFIPMAEASGLIVQLGEWALRAACWQIRSWHDAGLRNLKVSVNVSPRQFQQEGFAQTVAQILSETAIDPSTLLLEITETSIMQSAGQAVTLLAELKQMGLMVAIDDFGVGYSSLLYLKRLSIDMLKIDRSFVSDLTADPDDAALVMTIITLAHNLRLKVMAEGIETDDQLRFLHLLRCDEGQGYLFGKAMTPDLFCSMAVAAGHRHETLAAPPVNKQMELVQVMNYE